MAEDYGVADNALFQAQIQQYVTQQKVINAINEVLNNEDSLLTKKEYVKNRENIYAHPLIKELPKHSDAANRTATVLIDIIKTLGHKKANGSKLESFLNGEE